MVTMESKKEITLREVEIGYQGIECANKLHILYLFEKDIHFTDSFKETMKIINKNDSDWKDYIDIIDIISEKDDDHISNMAAALVSMHIERLEIVYEEDELIQTICMVSTLFKSVWNRGIRKWTRERHEWFPLVLSLGEFKR